MATPGKYGSLPRTLFPRCEGCSLGSGDSYQHDIVCQNLKTPDSSWNAIPSDVRAMANGEKFQRKYKQLRSTRWAGLKRAAWVMNKGTEQWAHPGERCFLRGPTWTTGDYSPSKQVSKADRTFVRITGFSAGFRTKKWILQHFYFSFVWYRYGIEFYMFICRSQKFSITNPLERVSYMYS